MSKDNWRKVTFFLEAFPTIDKEIVETVCDELRDVHKIEETLTSMMRESERAATSSGTPPPRRPAPTPAAPPPKPVVAAAAPAPLLSPGAGKDTHTANAAHTRLGMILEGIKCLGLLNDSEEEQQRKRAHSDHQADASPALPEPAAQPATPDTPATPATPQLADSVTECVVCLENPRQVVLLPCKHVCLCSGCAADVGACPICQADIADRMTVYIS